MTSVFSHDCTLIDTLRLSPREVETLLDKLNSRRDRLEGASKRRHPRVFFTEIQGVPLTISHPGGSTETYRVQIGRASCRERVFPVV